MNFCLRQQSPVTDLFEGQNGIVFADEFFYSLSEKGNFNYQCMYCTGRVVDFTILCGLAGASAREVISSIQPATEPVSLTASSTNQVANVASVSFTPLTLFSHSS